MAQELPVSSEPVRFGFNGNIPPRRVTLAYRVALGLSALAMVLLPLVYVALIVAVGFGIYFYAIHGVAILAIPGGGVMKLVLYAGPLFAGAILIVFMIKPLFARPARRTGAMELKLDQHPELHELIASICRQVRAPMPVQVELDCQVNASARLRRGLRSLGQRDLVLTIGLPLAASLTGRQLAGVLAHEFGHFAQGGGMATTTIIRSINGWFARLVFERDHWDLELESAGEKGGYQFAVMMAMARGGIWVSRRILHGLMHVGHIITCLQSRQMEYDADYYEIHLAGTAAFIDTTREMHRLSLAGQIAFRDLGQLWQTRQLVDDFPELVSTKRARFEPSALETVDASLTTTTGWMDTHPSSRDRLQHAEKLAQPGILSFDAPARVLFRDFAALSSETTRHFYRAQLGLTIDESRLVSSSKADEATTTAAAAQAAGKRLTQDIVNLTRPVLWITPEFRPVETESDIAVVGHKLALQRREITRLADDARNAESIYSNILEQRILMEQAHALLIAGVKINPRTFNLTRSDLSEAETEQATLQRRQIQQAERLALFDAAVHDWVCILGRAARFESSPLDETMRKEIVHLTDTLVDLGPWFSAFGGRHRRHFVLSVFFKNHEAVKKNEKFREAFKQQLEDVTLDVALALSEAGTASLPLEGTHGTMPAADVLKHALEGVEGAARLGVVLETSANSYFRILNRLALIGEKLERQPIPPAT